VRRFSAAFFFSFTLSRLFAFAFENKTKKAAEKRRTPKAPSLLRAGARCGSIPGTVGLRILGMPIALRCPGCNAALKVKDELAGRKVKCPKCAQPVPVPAEAPVPVPAGEEAAAPLPRKPAASAPPPPEREAAPPQPEAAPVVRRTVFRGDETPSPPSFDDLGLPVAYRAEVEKEISDEPILWMGRPDPGVMSKKYGLMGISAGAVITSIALAIILYLVLGSPDAVIMAVAGFFGLVFLLFGVGLLLTPVWIKKFAHLRPVYVLTDKRALLFDNKMGRIATRSYKPAQLRKMEVEIAGDGSGSLILEYIALVRETKRKRKPGEVVLNEHDIVKERGIEFVVVRNEGAKIPVGFLDIADVELVQRLLCDTFRLADPPKRSKSKAV
jgi:predicted Zn finger-like uncharacterized protein